MAEKTPSPEKSALPRLLWFSHGEIDVDESFVVGVDFLRKVLKSLSSGSDKWWLEEESANSVVLGHCANSADNRHAAPLLIRVPKIAPRRICLHWTAQEVLGAPRVEDSEGIDRFWGPLMKLLAECYLSQRKAAKRKSLRKLKERRVTLEDCVRPDAQPLTKATQEFLMNHFLVNDFLDHSVHKVLSNEDGFITDGRGFAEPNSITKLTENTGRLSSRSL